MARHLDVLIIEDGFCSQSSVHCKIVHHRDFPDIRAECGTTFEALDRLAHEFTRACDSAVSDCQRQAMYDVLSDISEYRETLVQTAEPVKMSV